MEQREVNAESIGPWSGDDLAKTAASDVGLGADSRVAEQVRFVRSVAKLIRRRLAVGSTASDPARPAIFLLDPAVSTVGLATLPRRVPMLDTGREVVNGRLWFVSAVAVTGKFVELDEPDDDSLFKFITDQLGLGDTPAVIFDPRNTAPEIRYYRAGLNEDETVEIFSINNADVSLDRIFDVLNKIYQNHLVTPEGQGKAGPLWKDKTRGWPVETAEDTVQLYLEVGLSAAFPTCAIRREQTQVSGRLDLEIEESDFLDPSIVKRHAILELKVLRSHRSSGTHVPPSEMDDWVTKGLNQASTYRDERGALEAALCCFDMRANDTGVTCFDHILSEATKLNVTLWRWYLYSKSELYRAAHVQQKLNP